MDGYIDDLKEVEKSKLTDEGFLYDERKEDKLANYRPSVWVGFLLIGVGAIFLFNLFPVIQLTNWWALLILIPGLSKLAGGISGRRNRARDGSIIGGLILTFIGFTFLFGLSLGSLWPVFLIIGGLGALIGGFCR